MVEQTLSSYYTQSGFLSEKNIRKILDVSALKLIQKSACDMKNDAEKCSICACLYKGKEELIALRTEGISTGVSFCEFMSANTSCAFSPLVTPIYPPAVSCTFMYVALCTPTRECW